MARRKSITLSAVNITMHPHKPEWYANMLESIHDRGVVTKVRGFDWGMIGTLTRHGKEGIITGTMWRFLNLDPSEPWLNLETHKQIDPALHAPIIPEHLKPHLRGFEYVFFPNGHRLFFDARKISPNTVQRLLIGLCSDPAVMHEFGDITVTVECAREPLDSILELARRAYVDIFVQRPNADELSSTKKRVFERMDNQNAASLNQVWKAPRGGDVQPDDETISLMELALSNGHVKAVGYTENDERVEIDSVSHPVKKDVHYDPDEESIWDILVDAGGKLMKYFRKRG